MSETSQGSRAVEHTNSDGLTVIHYFVSIELIYL